VEVLETPTHPQVGELDPLQVKGKLVSMCFSESYSQQIQESIRRALGFKNDGTDRLSCRGEDKDVVSGNVFLYP
jgi:hypothetical protein